MSSIADHRPRTGRVPSAAEQATASPPTGSEAPGALGAWVAAALRARVVQGLPPTVEDPAVLEAVAHMLRAAPDPAGNTRARVCARPPARDGRRHR